jgi:hypothetical protein
VTLAPGHDDGVLFAVAGPADAGTDFSAWADSLVVGRIGAGTNAVTATLPNEWWRNHYNIRFAWKSITGQPYDYAVEELVSDGTGKAHIRTGWIPTTNTTTRVVSRTAFDTCPFGVAGGYYVFLGAKSAPTKINWGFFKNAATDANMTGQIDCDSPDDFVAEFHTWQLGPTGVFVDDLDTPKAALSDFAPNASLTANICLPFRAISPSNHGDVNKAGDVETKTAKIWEGDILVRDFVPCVTNGVPVFYDAVRGECYGSRTAADFVAGAPVVADGDFVSWSPAKVLRSEFVITIR